MEKKKMLNFGKDGLVPTPYLRLSSMLPLSFLQFAYEVGIDNAKGLDIFSMPFIRFFRTMIMATPIPLDIENDLGYEYETFFKEPWED